MLIIITLMVILAVVVLSLLLYIKEPKIREPQQGDWSIKNQSDLTDKGFRAYIDQDKNEQKEERKERLEDYFSPDSPALDYVPQEVEKTGADRSDGEIIETRDCHEQEGNDLCLIINTRINYYKDNKKIKTEITPYWITIDYVAGTGFRIYDLGIWDYGYNENPI